MPDDPNKKMDELLKAYAEERRKAPELNLHPATRKILQGEVARVLDSTNTRCSWLHRFRGFWPQIAFGTSLCLVLGIAVISLRHQAPSPAAEKAGQEKNVNAAEGATLLSASEPAKPEADTSAPKKKDALDREETEQLQQAEVRLQKREQLQPAVPPLEQAKERFVVQEAQLPAPTTLQRSTASSGGVALGAQPPPLPAQQPQSPVQDLTLQDQKQTKPASVSEFYSADKSPSPRSASVETETRSRLARTPAPTARAGSSDVPVALPSLAVSPPADSSAAGISPSAVANRGLQISPSEKLARANEITNLGAARRLQFVQISATTTPLGTTAPTALLASFQMEQLGKDIRLVENDGSVYLGIIDQPAPLPAQTQVLADTVAERRFDERLSEQKKAVGAASSTNAVAFSFTAQGTNLTLRKPVVLTGQYFEKTNTSPSAADSLAVYQKTQAAARGLQRQESQHLIIGTAVVGTTNQVPVRAVARE